MSKAKRAAEIWAKLEQALIGQLMSGSQLDLKRPYLIRLIGDRLEAKNVEPVRADIARHVNQLAGLDENNNILPPPPDLKIDRTPHPWWGSSVEDPKLTAMLERSCSRRTGYDGDDEVPYAPRR